MIFLAFLHCKKLWEELWIIWNGNQPGREPVLFPPHTCHQLHCSLFLQIIWPQNRCMHRMWLCCAAAWKLGPFWEIQLSQKGGKQWRDLSCRAGGKEGLRRGKKLWLFLFCRLTFSPNSYSSGCGPRLWSCCRVILVHTEWNSSFCQGLVASYAENIYWPFNSISSSTDFSCFQHAPQRPCVFL